MVSHGGVSWPLNKQLSSVVLKKSDKNKAQSYSHVAKNRSGMWCLPAMHSQGCKGINWHFGTKGELLFIARLTKSFLQRIFFPLPFVASLSFPFPLTRNIALIVHEAVSSTLFFPVFKAVAGTRSQEGIQTALCSQGWIGWISLCLSPCSIRGGYLFPSAALCRSFFRGQQQGSLYFPASPTPLLAF